MQLVVVSFWPDRWRLMQKHADRLGVEIVRFEAVEGIPETYRLLAEEDWSETDVICQDDVRFPRGIPERHGPLTVYGTDFPEHHHTCPRAFTANAEVWSMLRDVWDGETQICEAWQPIVDQYATILDAAAHPKVARA